MHPGGLESVLGLPDDARVIDVGGWAAPVNRADAVIDLMPYETRGALMPQGYGPGPERFTDETWVQRDLCDREPYPFGRDEFDFAVCTFTLEDVRDPVWVCSEMSRIARAGYVEVPSLLDELTWEVPEASGGPWVGHDHHLWLCSLDGDELVFLKKLHSLHSNPRARVPRGRAGELRADERFIAHLWEGGLPARERVSIDSYPVEELERAIRDRFPPTLAERTRLAAGSLAGRARRKATAAVRGATSARGTG